MRRAVPTAPAERTGACVDCFPAHAAFPLWQAGRFPHCHLGFTHVTARRIAQPPEAAFVTRLQPFRLPGRAARQLPDQSTTLWVESLSTVDSRLRGALPRRESTAASTIVSGLQACSNAPARRERHSKTAS